MSHPRLAHKDIAVAHTVIRRVATVTFAFSVFSLFVLWATWNRWAPRGLQFDHAWSLPRLMAVTAAINIFLQPFMLISNQLQENSADERHAQLLARLEELEGKGGIR